MSVAGEEATAAVGLPTAPAAPHGRRFAGLAGEPGLRTASALSDTLLFTGGTYIAQGMVFVAGLLQKNLLGPTDAGHWALVTTLATFLAIAHLGVIQGASRQVPQRRGRGDLAGAARVADTAVTFTLLTTTVAAGTLALVAVTIGSEWPDAVRYGLILVAAIAPLRYLTESHDLLLTVTKRFDATSRSVVLQAFVMLTVQTLLVAWLGYWGMFAGMAASLASALALWWRMGLAGLHRPAFHVRLERRPLRELISFGGPIFVNNEIWLLFLTIDNLLVAAALGAEQLGFYALAVSVTSYIMLLPKSVGGALFPRMAERFGRTGDVADIEHYASDVQRVLAFALVPVLVAGAYFVFPVIVRYGLPEFTAAIPVVHFVVAGSFFLSLVNMPQKMLTTAGYRWSVAAVMLACLAFNATANVIALYVLDAGLEGAAVAASVSYGVLFVATTTFALSRVFPLRKVARHILAIVGLFAYITAALWGLEALIGQSDASLLADTALAALKFALFCVVLAPAVVYVQHRYGVLTPLLQRLRSRR